MQLKFLQSMKLSIKKAIYFTHTKTQCSTDNCNVNQFKTYIHNHKYNETCVRKMNLYFLLIILL